MKPVSIAPGVWTMEFPLHIMGVAVGRRVTLLEIGGGRLVIHSTAPFSLEDVEQIKGLGQPAALVEGTLLHDTFAQEGRAAFPDVPWFAPPSDAPWTKGARSVSDLNEFAAGALQVFPLAGMPGVSENLLYHPRSGSLVVCDLIFNIQPPQDPWTAFFFKYLNGTYARPGMTRLFRSLIRDRDAFQASIEFLLSQGSVLSRLIPAHGQIVEGAVGDLLREELRRLIH